MASDTGSLIKTSKLSLEFFIARKNNVVEPINNLNIPKVIIPPDLVKKRRPVSKDTITTYIRQLLNSITVHNVEQAKRQLLVDINEKVESENSLDEIASELLSSFIVSDTNIGNYMQILNVIYKATIRVTNKTTGEISLSKTIGNLFLDKCRQLIFKNISEGNILYLAKKNLDDDEELDLYNKERDKILNLIIVLCHLYRQRNTQFVKLTATHIYAVIDKILRNHMINQEQMVLLGDPYEGECIDEERYEYCRRMCVLYSEQLYVFFYNEGKTFKCDETNIKGSTLSDLITKFYLDVVPNLSEAHMQSKCRMLSFD